MKQDNLSLPSRISLAFGSFFSILGNRQFAEHVRDLRAGTPRPVAPSPAPLREPTPDAALQLLGLLQREARFVDFIQEDVTAYDDAQVGAAARLVHEGCRKVLRDTFTISPIREESEGSRITLEEGFDAAKIRLTGNVVGQPPFHGSIAHRGWQVVDTRLPRLAGQHEVRIVACAEVEL